MEKEENKNEYNITLEKILLHIKTILVHKYWVGKYCFKCGLYLRGIKHDLSKFSPAEFIPNIRYVKPGISPIDVQRQELGYAKAWFHHKGHNSHHWVHFADRFDEGCYMTRMPLDDAIECICDLIGANRAYNGKNYSPKTLIDYWDNKIKNREAIHYDTRDFIDTILHGLYDIWDYKRTGKVAQILDIYCCHRYSDILNYKFLKKVYNTIIKNSKNPVQIKLSDIIYNNYRYRMGLIK